MTGIYHVLLRLKIILSLEIIPFFFSLETFCSDRINWYGNILLYLLKFSHLLSHANAVFLTLRILYILDVSIEIILVSDFFVRIMTFVLHLPETIHLLSSSD